MAILEASHEEGVLESEERRMITNVVDFGDSLAKDVMVPRIGHGIRKCRHLTYDQLIQRSSLLINIPDCLFIPKAEIT